MRITARGVAIILVSLGLLGAGLAIGIAEAIMLGIIGLTLAFASLLATAASVRLHHIRVVRAAPTQLFCGQKANVTVQVTPKKLLKDGIATDLTPSGLAASGGVLRARGNVLELEYAITPTKTGHWNLGPLRWQKSDLFGLWVVTWWLGERSRITTWPRTTSLPVEGTFPAPKLPVGNSLGSNPDDVTLREYVSGDDLRRIHWATTARRGFPMVRENGGSAKKTIRVLIDPVLLRNHKTREWALEHGASVACSALEADHRVEIVAGSQTEFIECPINGRQQILTQITGLAAAHPIVKATNNSATKAHLETTSQVAGSRAAGAITYAIVGPNFAPKAHHATEHNYAMLVGNTYATGQTAADLRSSGWQVVHLRSPIGHQAAWEQVGV